MKKKIVIIGAGLGGCTVASKLCEWADVTIIQERAYKPINKIPKGIIDENGKGKPHEFAGAGLGGTSRYWHNGLIEIRDDILKEWPLKKEDLAPYIKEAFKNYSGDEYDDVQTTGKELRQKYIDLGITEDIACNNPIYYPVNRINAWEYYTLAKKVTVCDGYADKFDHTNGKITAVHLESGEKIEGDIFIVAAGGLQTPVLLQTLQEHGLCKLAGHFYEDHPWCFAGDIKLQKDFYKLWNYHTKFGGTMRQAIVIEQDGVLVSFFLRPSFHLIAAAKSAPVKSVMSDLRNKPFQIKNYFKLLIQLDDIFDIISFKLGINIKTDTFSLHVVAMYPQKDILSISKDDSGKIQRKWPLAEFHDIYEKALQKLLTKLGNNLISSQLFDGRWDNLDSASHHSGTARMAKNDTEGVCNKDCKVFGIANTYVCDGSVIPNSGIANTGLTIGALSLRLANCLEQKYKNNNEDMECEMIDCVVSGSNSTVGKKLIPLLKNAGLTIKSIQSFSSSKDTAKVFLNLANIPNNAKANLLLLKENLSIVNGRVQTIAQPQTIATMHSTKIFNKQQFNGGFTPKFLQPYMLGKLLQEWQLNKLVKKRRCAPTQFLYFGHVLNAGGPWGNLLEQAKLSGYILPENLTKARCNETKVEDICTAVLRLVKEPLKTGIVRELIVSEIKEWGDVLGNNVKRHSDLPQNKKAKIKRILRSLYDFTIGAISAILWSAGVSKIYYSLFKCNELPDKPIKCNNHQIPKIPVAMHLGVGGYVMTKQSNLR